MNLDFAKLDGLIPAVIQDHASGRVLMVGFMNDEAFRKTVETGFATFYSRSRNKLWLKGESSGHRLVVKEISTDCDRDAAARQSRSARPRRLPRRLRELLLSPARRRTSGWSAKRAPTIPTPSTEASREAQTRHSQRQPRERDHRSLPPRRLQDHHQQPLLFPGHRRSRNRVHAHPRAGDGALRRRRHPRRRPHRPRLGGGERGRRRGRRRSHLRQAELRQSALGAGRARSLAASTP